MMKIIDAIKSTSSDKPSGILFNSSSSVPSFPSPTITINAFPSNHPLRISDATTSPSHSTWSLTLAHKYHHLEESNCASNAIYDACMLKNGCDDAAQRRYDNHDFRSVFYATPVGEAPRSDWLTEVTPVLITVDNMQRTFRTLYESANEMVGRSSDVPSYKLIFEVLAFDERKNKALRLVTPFIAFRPLASDTKAMLQSAPWSAQESSQDMHAMRLADCEDAHMLFLMTIISSNFETSPQLMSNSGLLIHYIHLLMHRKSFVLALAAKLITVEKPYVFDHFMRLIYLLYAKIHLPKYKAAKGLGYTPYKQWTLFDLKEQMFGHSTRKLVSQLRANSENHVRSVATSGEIAG